MSNLKHVYFLYFIFIFYIKYLKIQILMLIKKLESGIRIWHWNCGFGFLIIYEKNDGFGLPSLILTIMYNHIAKPT